MFALGRSAPSSTSQHFEAEGCSKDPPPRTASVHSYLFITACSWVVFSDVHDSWRVNRLWCAPYICLCLYEKSPLLYIIYIRTLQNGSVERRGTSLGTGARKTSGG